MEQDQEILETQLEPILKYFNQSRRIGYRRKLPNRDERCSGTN